MSEEQLNASLDAEGAKLVEEGAEDVELTDEELVGVAGGSSDGGIVGLGDYEWAPGPGESPKLMWIPG